MESDPAARFWHMEMALGKNRDGAIEDGAYHTCHTEFPMISEKEKTPLRVPWDCQAACWRTGGDDIDVVVYGR